MGKGCINYNFSLVRLFRYSRRAQVRIWFNLSVAWKLKVCCICSSTMIIIIISAGKAYPVCPCMRELKFSSFSFWERNPLRSYWRNSINRLPKWPCFAFSLWGVGLHTKPLLRGAVGQTTLNPYEWGGLWKLSFKKQNNNSINHFQLSVERFQLNGLKIGSSI